MNLDIMIDQITRQITRQTDQYNDSWESRNLISILRELLQKKNANAADPLGQRKEKPEKKVQIDLPDDLFEI